MTLGAQDIGDRVASTSELLGGGAAGGDGGAQAGRVDAQGLGQRENGAAVGAGDLPVDEAGNGLSAHSSSFAPRREAPLTDDGKQHVPEGFGRASLGHAETFSESVQKNLAAPLDKNVESVETVERQEHGPGVIRQDSTEPAGPEPERNETVETHTVPPPAAQHPDPYATFRAFVERERARQAAAAAEPVVATCPTCRICEEPTSLLELRDLDGLCADCESEESERLRQNAWDSHWEDMAEWEAADRAALARDSFDADRGGVR